jgi:hypothetical protein
LFGDNPREKVRLELFNSNGGKWYGVEEAYIVGRREGELRCRRKIVL